MTTEVPAAVSQMDEDRIREMLREEIRGSGKSTNPRFDGTVNLGHLLTMTGIIGTLVVGGASLNTRLSLVEVQMVRQTEIIERVIRADEQMKSFGSRLERLERTK